MSSPLSFLRMPNSKTLSRFKYGVTSGIFILSVLLSTVLTPIIAQAEAVDTPDIDSEVTQWLYYRGIRACIGNFGEESNDDYTLDRSDVLAGQWFHDDKKGFGYLGPGLDDNDDNDGVVSCKDGSPIDRATEEYFGFKDEVEMLCKLDDAMDDLGAKDAIQPGAGDGDCESSNTFDIKSSKDNGDGNWRTAFTTILTDSLGGPPDGRPAFKSTDNPNWKAWYYWIGKRGLEVFCGDGHLISDSAYAAKSEDGGNYVPVSVVDATSGDIIDPLTGAATTYTKDGKPVSYYHMTDDDQGHTVDDAYYDVNDDTDAADRTCGELAQMTVDYAAGYKAWVLDHPGTQTDPPSGVNNEDPGSSGSGDSEATQCNIPKTGWILCPVLDTMANIGDQAFSFLSDNFLSVETDLFDTNSGTYDAWKKFRDIANIAFVIAVMIVVYSQITGAGISNYGIKKLLPKIVVAAILVNLSYFICQLAVDVSNILGYTLRDFFAGIAGNIKLPDGDVSGATGDGGPSPLDWAGIVAAIVITGTLVWLFLGALIPILLAALIAMFMILFILLARKALIVLLIALAPIAFVAYLLPNTEQWYKKWQKTFVQILMVFPIIAVVFGAAGLASKIVQVSDSGVMMRIIAAGIAVIPLFVVPGLLKRSIDAAGNVGAKLNSIGNKAGGWAGKKGGERFERSAIGRGRNLRRQAKQQYRDRRFAERLNNGGVTGVLAGGATGILPRRLQTKGVQYQQGALSRSATGTAIKADREDVAFAEQQLAAASYQHPEGAEAYLTQQFHNAVQSGDQVKARAALSALSKQGEGGVEAARSVIASNNGTMGDTMRQSLQQHINENHSDLKGKDSRITNWAGNSESGADADTSRGATIQDVDYGGLTDAQIAGQTKSSLSHARATGHLNDDDVDRILTNPDVSSELKRSKREVLGRSSDQQMDVIHQEALDENTRRNTPPGP